MGLPLKVDEQLSVALAAELARVEADERAAFDDASRASAYSGRRLYEVHVANVAKARASGDIAKAAEVYANIQMMVRLPSMVLQEAERRGVAGFVAEVGGGIAKDAAALAADTGKGWVTLLKLSPLVLVVLAALAVAVFARGAASRLPAEGSP